MTSAEMGAMPDIRVEAFRGASGVVVSGALKKMAVGREGH